MEVTTTKHQNLMEVTLIPNALARCATSIDWQQLDSVNSALQ